MKTSKYLWVVQDKQCCLRRDFKSSGLQHKVRSHYLILCPICFLFWWVWTRKSNVESRIEASFQNRSSCFFHPIVWWESYRYKTVKEIKNHVKIEWDVGLFKRLVIWLPQPAEAESCEQRTESRILWPHIYSCCYPADENSNNKILIFPPFQTTLCWIMQPLFKYQTLKQKMAWYI